MAFINFKMAVAIKENGDKIKNKEMECIIIAMEIFMRDNF